MASRKIDACLAELAALDGVEGREEDYLQLLEELNELQRKEAEAWRRRLGPCRVDSDVAALLARIA